MTPTTAPTPLLPPATPASAHAPLPGPETAVDAFAVRTLCCRVRGDRLQLASRADALAEGCDLDPQALFDYLFFHAIPSPRTVFQGVQRVPPAHRAELVDGQVRMTRTWTPEFEPDPSPDFDRLRGEFRAALQAAVASRLDGGKAACFLSGGTDSSTVAGMIGLASGKPAARSGRASAKQAAADPKPARKSTPKKAAAKAAPKPTSRRAAGGKAGSSKAPSGKARSGKASAGKAPAGPSVARAPTASAPRKAAPRKAPAKAPAKARAATGARSAARPAARPVARKLVKRG